ncbi:hypothetical protein BBJ28_00004268 [Nothophytophthora sp. Chile5]|nr:hypothetical protein BBJ28_00004268 [Nothophytophthora sp. Chile5]
MLRGVDGSWAVPEATGSSFRSTGQIQVSLRGNAGDTTDQSEPGLMEGEQSASEAAADRWEVRHDEASNQAYYWNASTGETTWEPPPHLTPAVPAVSMAAVVDPWTEAFDESGQLYYVNVQTLETRWTPPPTAHVDDGQVLAMPSDRKTRPTTAEQMDELNRLLSGDGEEAEDGEEDGGGVQGDSVHDQPPHASEGAVAWASEHSSGGGSCPWMLFLNEGDGLPYYYNHVTGECAWEPPEEFLRFHQQQQQQEEADKVEEVDGATTEESYAAVQAAITPEFEEKVRRAIAVASNTPVGSGRLVLVRTPTEQQLTARTGRSARGSETSQARDGSSRPSSGGAASRPRTPLGGVRSSRVHFENPPAIPAERHNEEDQQEEKQGSEVVSASAAERIVQPNAFEVAATGDCDPVKAEVEVNDEMIDLQREEGSVQEARDVQGEAEALSQPKSQSQEDEGDVNAPNAVEVQAENEDKGESDAPNEVKTDADGQIEAQAEGDGPVKPEIAEEGGEEGPDQTDIQTQASVDLSAPDEDVTVAVAPDDKIQIDVELNRESVDDADLDTEATVEGASSPVPVVSTEPAVLILQCMARCFFARGRMERRREERSRFTSLQFDERPVDSALQSEAPAVISACGQAERFTPRSSRLPGQTREEELAVDSESSSSGPEAAKASDGVLSSARCDPEPKVNSPVPENRPKREVCSFTTRLPSVLNVSRYFPTRCSVPRPSVDVGEVPVAVEPVAIVRKKVEAPSLVDRASSSSDEAIAKARAQRQLLAARKEEEVRVYRAQVLEYQRIYTESKRAFENERQQVIQAKLERDNQLSHKVETAQFEPKQLQTQEKRDVERSAAVADASVWELMQLQSRPTTQHLQKFQNALDQTLLPAHFADKMCLERVRELQERVERLHAASWVVESQLETLELRLLSESNPLSAQQRPLQAKHVAKLRRRHQKMLDTIRFWQRVLDDSEAIEGYWGRVKASYGRSGFLREESRRQYVLQAFRGGLGGDSLLHVAACNGWEAHARYLLAQGADVNLVDSIASRSTSLHEACRPGHASVVQLLLSSGARLDAVDSSGDSALHVACRAGWTRVVRLLLSAASEQEARGDDASSVGMGSEMTGGASDWTLRTFFNLRNGKRRRAVDVATVASLLEELERKWPNGGYVAFGLALVVC